MFSVPAPYVERPYYDDDGDVEYEEANRKAIREARRWEGNDEFTGEYC